MEVVEPPKGDESKGEEVRTIIVSEDGETPDELATSSPCKPQPRNEDCSLMQNDTSDRLPPSVPLELRRSGRITTNLTEKAVQDELCSREKSSSTQDDSDGEYSVSNSHRGGKTTRGARGGGRASSGQASSSKKRKVSQSTTEKTSPKKRGRKSTSILDADQFNRNLASLGESYAAQTQKLEQAMAEIEKLRHLQRKSEVDLQNERKASQLETQSLVEDLETLRGKYSKLDETSREQISELTNWNLNLRVKVEGLLDAAKPKEGIYLKVTDDEICRKLGVMSSNVRNFVSNCLEMPLELSEIPQDDPRLMLLQRIQRVPAPSGLQLQAHIWQLLRQHVWLGRLWRGEVALDFTSFVSTLQGAVSHDADSLEAISQVKSTTAQRFERIFDLTADMKTRTLNEILAKLFYYIPKSNTKQSLELLSKLLHDAVDLHVTLMKSKAIFFLGTPGSFLPENKYYPFDSESMEICWKSTETPSHECHVSLVLSPSLIKIGNADGGSFGHRMVLCKAAVALVDYSHEIYDRSSTQQTPRESQVAEDNKFGSQGRF